jgi:hypothetical protein
MWLSFPIPMVKFKFKFCNQVICRYQQLRHFPQLAGKHSNLESQPVSRLCASVGTISNVRDAGQNLVYVHGTMLQKYRANGNPNRAAPIRA